MSNKDISHSERLRLLRKSMKAITLMMKKNNSNYKKPKPGTIERSRND
ncbi:MAG: hypothetical protein M3Z26_13055 [Bacteroidota bacterium]|nr:hypothetical protein [Bacteroidota bacterium]